MRRLFKAALIVTIFSIATRGLGFVLRIVLSRYLGAEMLGNYQVAMSIFGVLMTIVASGLPLIISRTVSYKKSSNDKLGAYKSTCAGLILTLSISIVISLIIVFFPNLLNIIVTNDHITSIIIYTMPALITSAIYCVLRSALWGDKHFFAISFTEFFEQIVRIIICFILFSSTLLPSLSYGEKAGLSLSIACLASSILVVIIYFCLGKKLKNPKGAFKPIIKSSTPITMLRTLSSLITSLIAIIIPLRLQVYGYSNSQSMAEFGMIMGMAFPLIMIPGTLISSLAVTLVPEISSKTDNIDDKSHIKDLSGLKRHISLGINASILITMLFIPAFMVLGKPICEILFNSKQAGKYVCCGAILILPLGISQITSSILNSIGLEIKSLINYAVGAIGLFISILFLPKYFGTYALIIGMCCLSSVSSILNLRMLKKRELLKFSDFKYLLYLAVFIILSALLGLFTFNLLKLFLPLFLSTVIAGIICVSTMVLLCYIFNIAKIKNIIIIKFKRKIYN